MTSDRTIAERINIVEAVLRNLGQQFYLVGISYPYGREHRCRLSSVLDATLTTHNDGNYYLKSGSLLLCHSPDLSDDEQTTPDRYIDGLKDWLVYALGRAIDAGPTDGTTLGNHLSKDTNPKDAASELRLPLHLIPAIANTELALALYEGAWKYTPRNWRTAGIRSSVYISAALRHLMKFNMGEDRDAVSNVHHLGSVMACCAILLDAMQLDMITDDRDATDEAATADIGKLTEQVMLQVQSAFDRGVSE